MTIVCNIWMICLELNWFFTLPVECCIFLNLYGHIRSSVDATDRSKISSDQKRFFIALSIYPFHFSRTLPLKWEISDFFLQNFLKKTFLVGTQWNLHLKPSYTSIKNWYLITLLKHMNHPFKIPKLTHYRWNRMICQKHESLG